MDCDDELARGADEHPSVCGLGVEDEGASGALGDNRERVRLWRWKARASGSLEVEAWGYF